MNKVYSRTPGTYTLSVAIVAALFSQITPAADWRGNISSEITVFPSTGNGTATWKTDTAIAADIEFYHDLADTVSFAINPFLRIDQRDSERTHGDLREFKLTTYGDNWEFTGGIDTVFWGVTESRHLVDVINQTDGVEGVDGEDKLGQPMMNFRWFSEEAGDFEIYLMPLFREQTFAGRDGRPSSGLTVDTDTVEYESGNRRKHLDTALRWTRSFDYWDIGLHAFRGTARDPLLKLQQRAAGPVLIPRYQQIKQAGIDAQGLYGDLSVKIEAVYRNGDEIESHGEAVTGIEYTLVGPFGALQDNDSIPADWCEADSTNFIVSFICNDRLDIGIVVEYLWDERGKRASHPFQNDLLAGVRLAFNDEATSDALLGVVQDLDGGATTLSLEASTRVFESYRLSFEVRKFAHTRNDSALAPFRDQSFLRVDLRYFF
ncbi:hypothetical protein AB833_17615 [Chromatiales bacterium (ex Bugula neritina AB1)]|nr:hypothetical protein AB833_17615 [Chromatiales bacterium (ex Bugula neritina AB1)]